MINLENLEDVLDIIVESKVKMTVSKVMNLHRLIIILTFEVGFLQPMKKRKETVILNYFILLR